MESKPSLAIYVEESYNNVLLNHEKEATEISSLEFLKISLTIDDLNGVFFQELKELKELFEKKGKSLSALLILYY